MNDAVELRNSPVSVEPKTSLLPPFCGQEQTGILKTEWLYDDHFIGLEDAYKRVAEVINIYNTRRPHLSLDYKTPEQAYSETGEQKKVWKNVFR